QSTKSSRATPTAVSSRRSSTGWGASSAVRPWSLSSSLQCPERAPGVSSGTSMANPLVASLSALGRVAPRPLGTRALRSSIALALLLGAPLACQPRATLPPPTPVYADTITVPPQDILCDSVNAPGADHKCATGADAAPSRAKSEDGSSN